MDRIIKNQLDDYQGNFHLDNYTDSELFEMFCCYSIISQFVGNQLEIQDVTVGGGNDCGIDGLAILAVGHIIDAVETFETLAKQYQTSPEIKLIFVQAKTSPKFDTGDILKFWRGVKDFLSKKSKLKRSKQLEEKTEILNYILAHYSLVSSISIKLFYVTTGTYYGDDSNQLKSLREDFIKELLDEHITDNIKMEFLGSLELQRLYRKTKNQLSAEIHFEHRVLIPEIEEIQEAYIGYLPLKEYKKLIVNKDGELKKGVYYDNVRDFKGEENPVNSDIAKTLQSAKPDQLVILNNGVTIVAKKITQSRDTFHLEDYQIVNGCQTSHVIYYNLDKVNNFNVGIPVKIIATKNESIINELIKATNNQTKVERAELLALSDFQKRLEEFYSSFTKKSQCLYYERRSDQYAGVNEIEKVRIVDIQTQIKSFSAMFLELPHLAKGYFGKLIDKIDGKYFLEHHHQMPYYTSAFSLYKLEYFFRNKNLEYKYRKFTFQILMLLKYVITQKNNPPLESNSKKIEAYCNQLHQVLDSPQAILYFIKAIEIIESTVEDIHDKELPKKQSFTKKLIQVANQNIYQLM
jgi:hypothetical protein